MISLPGYTFSAKLYESPGTIIYRGERNSGNPSAVIAKQLKSENSSNLDLARFEREYAITHKLDAPGVVRCLGLERAGNHPVIIFQDIRGTSLDRVKPVHRMSLTVLLGLAVKIAEAIDQIHRRGIIHKNINPSHIIWNRQTDELNLIDFGIASELVRETSLPASPEVLEGTLAYISPEQTGRMNRFVDRRTDMYSFGVTLFELLTGSLPYQARDPLELVHAHIARNPIPPYQFRPDLPPALYDIITKLMTKNAEDRYQSARGVIADLSHCLAQIKRHGTVARFVVGKEDRTDKFTLPEKLYGRQPELDRLTEAYARVSEGRSELVLVSGQPGIGKTFLIREIQKSLDLDAGYFISGKFDQYKRNIPYACLIDAFSELIRLLLTESSERLSHWRRLIGEAIGGNGAVLIDYIPDLELVIGKQPPVPELPLAEAKNRFHMTFQNFIQVFTSQSVPLVIFLDDLQWADTATLSLLQLFLTDPGTRTLLVIGAYRDKTIDDQHPLLPSLAAIQKADMPVSRILLEPLGQEDVNRLVADTLRADPEKTAPLSCEILKKTGGNPFFIREFLKSLYQEAVIAFDHQTGRWSWDNDLLGTMEVSDNVVELMAQKIQTLEPRLVEQLKLAACIGNRFSLQSLARVSGRDLRSTMELLWPAVREELILPLDKNYPHLHFRSSDTEEALLPPLQFRFSHDRVQQAVYQMLSGEEAQGMHLRIARGLLQKTDRHDREDHLFDIVNQFNLGRDLIRDPHEIRMLARLNLKSGKKAKNSAAYDTALVYFSTGLQLLPADSWGTDYDLTYALSMGCAECEYLNGFITKSEARFRLILEKVHTDLEKVSVYRVIAQIYQNLGKYKDAVGVGTTALDLLKIRIPVNPGKNAVLAKLVKIRYQLRRRRIESLRHLPQMTDEHVQAVMDTLAVISGAAFIYDRYAAIYNILTMLELTLKYGNSRHSPFVFAFYALILCSGAGKYDTGYAYGRMAVSMAEDSPDRNTGCKTRFIFARGVTHWARHAKHNLDHYRAVYKDGMESGNLVYAGWGALYIIVASIITGVRLDHIAEEIRTYSRFMKRIKYDDILHFCVLPERYIAALQGNTGGIADFSGSDFDEAAYVQRMRSESQFSPALVWYYIMKIQACCLAGQYDTALALSDHPKAFLAELQGTLLIPEYDFYTALSIAATYPAAGRRKKRNLHRRLVAIRKAFEKWAKTCPENFAHKHLLICAEIARIEKKADPAGRLYQQAVESADASGYIQNAAIANECAARFYLASENRESAAIHLRNARFGYLEWGATAKAEALTECVSLTDPIVSQIKELSRPHAVRHSRPVSYGSLEWMTMAKALHAISSEIHLPALIETLMRITMENAGAQRGVLLLAENDRLVIAAETRTDQADPVLSRSAPLTEQTDLPVSMIQYCARKAEPVILEDAATHHLFADDAYFRNHRKHSVLCHPIVHIGKPVGILYLENDLAPNIFTPDRAQMLDLLTAQAAISLENARLYNRLKESENKYRSIFENAVEGMFQIAPDGRFLSVNRSLATILGHDGQKSLMEIGSEAVDLFFADQLSRETFTEKLKTTGEVIEFEGRGNRRNGNEFWASVSTRAVFDDQGQLLYYEGSLVDITERKEREWAERQRKAAEATAQAKNVFLANISHEIRTPLNAITGLSELVLMTDLNLKQRDFLYKIKSSADSLLRIIDDILQYAKIESGSLELETVEFSIANVLEKIDFMFSSAMSEKGVELIFSISEAIPSVLTGDPLRISQVLINLVSNALKFTESGEIIVGVRPIKRGSETVRLQFFVSDTGIGMAESDIPKLFDAFVQIDDSITRRYGGTGLGLAICRNIVKLMNGRIWAESKQNRGSTFYFEVDLACSRSAPPERRGLPDAYAGKTALVVDDNPVSQTMLCRQLENMGLAVTSCDSGEAALALFSEKRSAPLSDLVFMDWKLPGMDGIETIRQIRQTGHDPFPLFILVTAFGWEAARLEIETGDADAFLTKPIHAAKLRETITDLFQPQSPHPRAVDGRCVPDFRWRKPTAKARLLLVDDNTINREITTEILQQSGFVVDVAENGQEAIAAVERRAYNAVLMDVQMPVMDGYEATRIIRSNPRNRELIIIAMTAHAMEGYRRKCLDAGMNDYITKPVDLGRLHELLGTYTANAPSEKADAPPEKPASAEIPDSMPGIDIRSAIRRIGGNRRLYTSMIKSLLNQYGNIGVVLSEALEKNELELIERTSHTLKGLAGNIGAQPLRTAATALNRTAKAGRPDEIRSALNDLTAKLESVLPNLQQLAALCDEDTATDAAAASDTPESISAALSELDSLLGEGHSSARDYFGSIRARLEQTAFKRFVPQLATRIENYDYDEARQILGENAIYLDISTKGGS